MRCPYCGAQLWQYTELFHTTTYSYWTVWACLVHGIVFRELHLAAGLLGQMDQWAAQL